MKRSKCAVRDGHREMTTLELDSNGMCSCGKARCSGRRGSGLRCYENASVCADTWPKFFEVTEGRWETGPHDFLYQSLMLKLVRPAPSSSYGTIQP